MSKRSTYPVQCDLGPVMRDVPGLELSDVDIERLLHPNLGGVVLFAENYANKEQLKALVGSIHALRSPALLVCVDQEGGRVQRFRDEFVRIPPMREFGRQYETNPDNARRLVTNAAHILGSELITQGIDISFTPVVDLSLTENPAIGDRAFHSDPERVAELATCFVNTLRALGLPAVGKHFPGHGGVEADSHLELPVDGRSMESLEQLDLIPYRRLIEANCLDAVMTAHVLYDAIDASPPTFSSFWIQQQLRRELGFNGVVFSDDLHMQGAVDVYSGAGERGQAALSAGCDVLLMCRDPQAADAMCDYPLQRNDASAARVRQLTHFCRANREKLLTRIEAERAAPDWQARATSLAELVA